MNDEELFEKIKNKELTICETCDTIFPYSPQKKFCDECYKERWRLKPQRNRERYANDPEYRKRVLEANREWAAKKRQEDPEWQRRRNAIKRLAYKRKKQEEE